MFYDRERQRVESLEKELAALNREHEKLLAAEREMAGKLVVDDKPELKELLDYMNRMPLLYFKIMTH